MTEETQATFELANAIQQLKKEVKDHRIEMDHFREEITKLRCVLENRAQ